MDEQPNATRAAFETYCQDPIVVLALAKTKGSVSLDLLRDAFMRGAAYAIARARKELKEA